MDREIGHRPPERQAQRRQAPGSAPTGAAAEILALQRQAGNAAVATLMRQPRRGGAAAAAPTPDDLAGLEADDSAVIESIVRDAATADARGQWEPAMRAFRARRYLEAARLFQRMQAIAPSGRSELAFNACQAYMRHERTRVGRAAAPSREAIDQARPALEAAIAAYYAGDYRRAVQEFREADRLVPSAELAFNIGMAYERLGRPGDAAEAFRLHQQRGGRGSRARLRAAERAIAANPAAGLTERDLDALAESDAQAAESVVRGAEQADAGVAFTRGAEAFRRGDHRAAADEFAAAEPLGLAMRYNRALALYRAGDYEAAAAEFGRYYGNP